MLIDGQGLANFMIRRVGVRINDVYEVANIFKMTAVATAGQGLHGLLNNVTFWIAITMYGVATVVWIPTIKSVPISRAYLFMALTYLYVPIFHHILGEHISLGSIFGNIIVIVGIIVSVWS